MKRKLAIRYSLSALLLCACIPASHAATEWASWSLNDPTDTVNPRDALGSFADGRSIIATGNLSSFKSPGTLYIADPAVPGAPGNGNPSYILAPTGMPGGSIATDEAIMIFDLTGFPVDDDTLFGIADMLDAQSNPLSLDELVLTNYNLTYPNDLVADFNILLNRSTGLLSVDGIHDSGTSNYIHSGLTTFGNLPSQAEMIRILSGQDQLTEGVQWYFGGAESIPLPGAVWLFASGLLLLGKLRRKNG